MEFELTTEMVERFATRCALGNNGGDWATHYTEDQKEYWRKFVKDLAKAIDKAIEEALIDEVVVLGTTGSVAL